VLYHYPLFYFTYLNSEIQLTQCQRHYNGRYTMHQPTAAVKDSLVIRWWKITESHGATGPKSSKSSGSYRTQVFSLLEDQWVVNANCDTLATHDFDITWKWLTKRITNRYKQQISNNKVLVQHWQLSQHPATSKGVANRYTSHLYATCHREFLTLRQIWCLCMESNHKPLTLIDFKVANCWFSRISHNFEAAIDGASLESDRKNANCLSAVVHSRR